MKELFQIAGGSVLGRLHAQALSQKNNQDSYGWHIADDMALVVVCDGCGSGKHSEVGAKLGCNMVLEQLILGLLEIKNKPEGLRLNTAEELLESVRRKVAVNLHWLIMCLRDEYAAYVNDYFLFSIVGAIITPKTTVIFSLGDGVYFLNGEKNQIGPFEGNMPPYLAYSLVKTRMDPQLMRFQVQRIIPTPELNHLLIGTDGVEDLINAANLPLPGKQELVGEVSQFWEQDRFFNNPDMVRRRLSLINHELTESLWHERRTHKYPGHLPDDTTLVVVRRKKE